MSKLQVETISHTNNTTGMTIDSSGRVLYPARPMVQVITINTNRFGQDHGATTYDTNYRSPIPTFTSAHRTTQINQGGGTLAFVSHVGGEYLKYTVPITGVYEFGLGGNSRQYSDGDFIGWGFMKNTVAEASSGNLDFPISAIQGMGSDSDEFQHNIAGTTLISLNVNDFVVPYIQSSQSSSFPGEVPLRFYGYLKG